MKIVSKKIYFRLTNCEQQGVALSTFCYGFLTFYSV